ncbi:MAG: 50S ribosomal protein L13 [Bacteroidia bacterium]|nr:50S ribosomal protein L13 [Bacteroidia bacterium]
MDSRSYKTLSLNLKTADKKWVIVDAEGQVLGRLASQISMLLRGKHKPGYTPHADCGDNVIVINAEKVRVTGRKMDQKEYVRHTGYMGGQRFTPIRRMLAEKPERVIEFAVWGMMPKGPLGRKVMRNLRVYAGTTHPHTAQAPEPAVLPKP